MPYQPTSFHFVVDKATGLKVYDDERLQTTYLNLRVVSDLIHDVQVSANNDLLYVQKNVEVSAAVDQTPAFVASMVCKLLEGMSSAFTAGTGAAIAATVIGKLSSAIITQIVKSSTPEDEIQQKCNEVRSGMDAFFGELKKRIDTMITHLEEEWDKPYECEGALGKEYAGTVYLHDFADFDGSFPDHNSPEYDEWHSALAFQCKYLATRALLGAKWRVHELPSYKYREYYVSYSGKKQYDFDHEMYNPHTDEYYWTQHFDGLPIPGSFGSYYEIESHEGGTESFAQWLRNLCLDPRGADRYKYASTYYNWIEKYYPPVVDNRAYSGYEIKHAVLMDSAGGYAPSSLGSWLFIDDGTGKVINKNGIATRADVYKNWGLHKG